MRTTFRNVTTGDIVRVRANGIMARARVIAHLSATHGGTWVQAW